MLRWNRFCGMKTGAMAIALGLTMSLTAPYTFADDDISNPYADIDIQMSLSEADDISEENTVLPGETEDLTALIDVKNDSGGIACIFLTVAADGYLTNYRMVFDEEFMSEGDYSNLDMAGIRAEDQVNENDNWQIMKNDDAMVVSASGNIEMEASNEISIIIKVDLLGGKVQDVTLTLNKKKMNDNAIIEELVKKVNQLEEENKSLKKDIKDIKEKFNLFEKYFADEIKYKKMIEELGIDSKIIKQKEDLEFLTKRLINNDENLKQKKINYNLIYRATRDGDSLNSFHSRVDNKRSHLSIIETNKGLKFGVFIEQPFKHANKLFNDNKSFVFSLNLKKIYNAKCGEPNFFDDSRYLINLYYQPILIVENCLSNNKSYTCSKSNADNSYTGFEKDYELNNNEQFFQVKEMETFLIEFK